MHDSQRVDQEKSVLRWGGLAGELGSLALIVAGIVSVTVGTDYAQLEELFRFPEARAERTVENTLYLLALLLMASHFLALHQTLRNSHRAPALFGSGLGVVGLALMAAGALLHMASIPLSDLYHDPDTTAEAQATLALIWQATWGVFDALFAAGLFEATIGVVALGTAMLRAPILGRGIAWLSIVLGVIGIAATLVHIVDPPSPIAALGVFALIVFHVVLGWKLYSLSKAPVSDSGTMPGEETVGVEDQP